MGSGADDTPEELNVVGKIEQLTTNPLNEQIGGSHYKDMKIQPMEFCMANNFNGLQTNIIKRISRYNHPTGKGLQDLLKIKHEIDLLIELGGLIKLE